MFNYGRFICTRIVCRSHIIYLGACIWVLLAFASVRAQDVRPAHSDSVWQATYWNNGDLAGQPALQREEGELNHNWGSGSPGSTVSADGFSARWTRQLYLEGGTYRFSVSSDDGIRVFLNDERIIDAWFDHSVATFSTTRQLASGHYLVRVEYYENWGQAAARFDWARVSGGGDNPVQGWRAEYFNNSDLSGTPILVRDDNQIDFSWGGSSPAPGIVNSDYFSARWTRTLSLAPGNYRFHLTTDDGARLWVNNHLLIDVWREQGTTTYTGEIFIPGNVPVRLEYFEARGEARMRLTWEKLDHSPPGQINKWRGEYFNNRDLRGAPVLIREADSINFDWATGSPAPGIVNSDDFSVRWTRNRHFDAGTYRVRLTADDGVRFWINDRLLIDAWKEQSSTTYSGEMFLSGQTTLRLEYFESRGGALVRIRWERLDQPPSSATWRGEYFNNRHLSGTPALVRNDTEIKFNWGNGAPAAGVNADDFSVRWSRTVHFKKGRYRFTSETDDGVRVYVDNRLVIDKWRDMERTKFRGAVNLSEGTHTIRMEYYEHSGAAFAKLSWKLVEAKEESQAIGNLITCVPPQPDNYAWIKLYRLDGQNQWQSTGSGIGSIHANGFLKIDGLPINLQRFGSGGEPYRVEQWIDGRVTRTVGDIYAGQPEFRLRPAQDNYTPWQC